MNRILIETPEFPDYVVKAKDFEKEGKNVIQAAVNKCHAAGGGMVLIEAGVWESGPIHLKSNIHLKMERGCEIHFSQVFEDYLPVVFTRWEGMECYNYSPLIYAKDCKNIGITGAGTLCGGGEAWWYMKKEQAEAAKELCFAESNHVLVDNRVYGTRKAALRPSFIQSVNCQNVWLEGFTIQDGPQWTLHPVYCEDVLVRDVTVSTHGPNTDGLNPDSCNRVLIDHCVFDTGDDCIAINSGMNEDGWRVGIPCQNVEIRDCIMNGGHGGVVIGSGMSGGVQNIYVHDCEINHTMQGIRLKSMRGRGGYVKNAIFDQIEIHDVSDQAIQINMFYESSTVQPKQEAPSDFREITITNVNGSSHGIGIQIKGLPEHKLKRIRLKNIHLEAEESMVCSNVKGMEVDNVTII